MYINMAVVSAGNINATRCAIKVPKTIRRPRTTPGTSFAATIISTKSKIHVAGPLCSQSGTTCSCVSTSSINMVDTVVIILKMIILRRGYIGTAAVIELTVQLEIVGVLVML